MADKQKKGRQYEPPVIKEIGGVFEQAMGATQCTTGGSFRTGNCKNGMGAATGCKTGSLDQACLAGGSDAGGCTTGWGN